MVYEYSLGMDLSDIGHFSGIDSAILTPEKRDEYCRFSVSLALFRGIGGGQTPTSSLTIRELSPSLDLVDAQSRPIESDLWKQEFDASTAEGMLNATQVIYRLDRNSRLNQKIILLYGVYIPTSFTNISEIQIWKKRTKLIDRLYTNGHIPGDKRLNTPIMFWTDVNGHGEYEIRAKFEGGPTKIDNIRLLGYVVESLGVNTFG